MKNKVFSLGYYYYDDGGREFFLYHENKTKKDFKQDVLREMKEYAEECKYNKNETLFIGTSAFFHNAYEKLLEKGYEEFKPVCFGVFGSNIISKEDKEWESVLGEELFNKVVDVNNKIRD
jgi:hypothetical protein